jgi:S1-C subfamily serine protease
MLDQLLRSETSDQKIIQIIRKNLPTIVSIFALKPISQPLNHSVTISIKDEYFEKVGNSSGFIATTNGLIVTNFHPISNRQLVYKIL